MNNIMAIGRNGLKSIQDKINVTANDIANINTVAYKNTNCSFEELIYNQISDNEVKISDNSNSNSKIGTGVKVNIQGKDFSQGDLQYSPKTFNMGISGEGFFGVETSTGDLLLTRNGQFHINSNKNIIDDLGNKLSLQIKIPIESWDISNIEIRENGNIYDRSNNNNPVGKVILYRTENKEQLLYIGNGYFDSNQNNIINSIVEKDKFGNIVQNSLEMSNVDTNEKITEMISLQRSFQLNAKSINTADETMNIINRLTD